MEQIQGDIRRFAMINTTDYNCDGVYFIGVVGYNELEDNGWHLEEKNKIRGLSCEKFIDDMSIGELAECAYFTGAYLMRIA